MSTYGANDIFNKLQLILPFRPLGNPLYVDKKMLAICPALPLGNPLYVDKKMLAICPAFLLCVLFVSS